MTLTLCNPMDWSLPGFSSHRILQARILEWVAIPFSRGSSWPKGLNPCLLSLLPWQACSLPVAPLGKTLLIQFQFSHSVVSDSVTSWTAACQASLSITNSRSFIELMSIELVIPSHPLSSPSLPAFNLSQHQGLLHQVAKVLEFPFQHQSFQWIVKTDFL